MVTSSKKYNITFTQIWFNQKTTILMMILSSLLLTKLDFILPIQRYSCQEFWIQNMFKPSEKYNLNCLQIQGNVEDWMHQKSSRENCCNFWSENKKKVPNVAYESHLIGEETPLQGWVTQKMLWGGTRALKIKNFDASTIFGWFARLFF